MSVLFVRRFASLGHAVKAPSRCEEPRSRAFCGGRFDLMVLDYKMPGKAGIRRVLSNAKGACNPDLAVRAG